MRIASTAALCAGLILTGCVTPGSNTKTQYISTATDTRAYAGKCAFVQGDFPPAKDGPTDAASTRAIPAVLLSLLAGYAIEYGANLVGTALQDAATPKDALAIATTNIDTLETLKCIHIVRGKFAANAGMNKSAEVPALANVQNQLTDQRIYLAEKPHFFMEIALRAPYPGIMAPVPTYVYYGKPSESQFLRPSGKRHITVGFAVSTPGEKITNDRATEIILGELEPDTEINYGVSGGANAYPAEGRWLVWPVKNNKPVVPTSLTATVIEHQSTSAFYGMLAKAFAAKKDDIVGEAKRFAIPSERDKALEQEQQRRANEEAAYDKALNKTLDALNACGKSGARADAVTARSEIDALALLGRSMKGVTRDSVPLIIDAAKTRESCQKAEAALGS